MADSSPFKKSFYATMPDVSVRIGTVGRNNVRAQRRSGLEPNANRERLFGANHSGALMRPESRFNTVQRVTLWPLPLQCILISFVTHYRPDILMNVLPPISQVSYPNNKAAALKMARLYDATADADKNDEEAKRVNAIAEAKAEMEERLRMRPPPRTLDTRVMRSRPQHIDICPTLSDPTNHNHEIQ